MNQRIFQHNKNNFFDLSIIDRTDKLSLSISITKTSRCLDYVI